MGFRKKSHATYTNLFPFEHNGAQFEIISGENQSFLVDVSIYLEVHQRIKKYRSKVRRNKNVLNRFLTGQLF